MSHSACQVGPSVSYWLQGQTAPDPGLQTRVSRSQLSDRTHTQLWWRRRRGRGDDDGLLHQRHLDLTSRQTHAAVSVKAPGWRLHTKPLWQPEGGLPRGALADAQTNVCQNSTGLLKIIKLLFRVRIEQKQILDGSSRNHECIRTRKVESRVTAKQQFCNPKWQEGGSCESLLSALKPIGYT
jgi:hypothetical protein